MADWQIVYKDLAADEFVPIVPLVPPRLLAQITKSFQGLDLTSDPPPEIMIVCLFRQVPDPEEFKRVAEERERLNKLAAEAGARIKRQLEEQGQI